MTVAPSRRPEPAAPTWTRPTPHAAPRARRPQRLVAHTLMGAALAGLVAVLALALVTNSVASLSAPGGWFLAVARLCGLTGSYLLLIMVVLMARVPALERAVGQDRLVRWHRTLGPWSVSLIALHVVSVVLGYAALDHTNPLHQLVLFVLHYPDVLAAMVGFSLLVTAAVSSHHLARDRMRYESWWTVHVYTYLALALAFMHQIRVGIPFLTHALARQAWIGAWALAALTVLAGRVVLPAVRNARHRLRLVEVREVAPGVHSLILRGRGLEDLSVAGGQFFQWRFLARGLWWHSHPYSLSALPQPPYLRLTVKDLGDQSHALAHLRPGTPVLAEGPYGAFTHHHLVTRRALLVGAGVGVTPVRALLEDLPRDVAATVIVRASRPEELVHADELAALVTERGGQYHELVGPRTKVRLDARALRRLVPDVAERDLYVCGPTGFTTAIVEAARRCGVAPERIHLEAFAF